MLFAAGNPAEGLEAFRKELPLRRELAASKPDDIDFKTSLASCCLNIGGALPLGKYEERMEATRDALVIYQKLVEDYPAVDGYKSALAAIQINMAVMLTKQGKLAEALEAFRTASAVYQKLVDDNPTLPEYQFAQAVIVRNTGNMLKHMGKPAEGLELFRKALAIGQKLVDANPANTRFQDIQAKTHNAIGVVLLAMGKSAEALDPLQKALTIAQKLVDANPASSACKNSLSACHNNIGLALGRQKRFAEAFTALDAGLAIRQKLAEADPTNTDYSELVAYSYAYRGAVRVRAGQPAEAAADLRQALEQWAKVPNLDAEAQFNRSRTLALLAGLGGLAGDAKSGVTKEEAKTFADQSVAALAAVVQLGWSQPSELRESDFDALRGRADFQKLAAEVEAKAEKPAVTVPTPGENKGGPP
ncbi:MAG TPA: tetratricopeptide repeat protein [Gemmataceae bacterium]|nr:tetratricopeptide repeat protein [Gemmataceae bacterium]